MAAFRSAIDDSLVPLGSICRESPRRFAAVRKCAVTGVEYETR
jgi:hypothetical protein